MSDKTMDGFFIEPVKKPGAKSQAKKSKKAIPVTEEPDTTLDLVWTLFAATGILLWRLTKWTGRHIVGIAATAFLIENLLLLQHLTHFAFK